VDVSANGYYDPSNGDYPDIKGDQAIYFIQNDQRSVGVVSSIGIEIHGMLYGFDEANDSALNNTLFLSYKIIHRGASSVFDTYIGFWTDMDIGYEQDDYIGCDVTRNSYYTYNGTGSDRLYWKNVAAQSVTFLNGPDMDGDGKDNQKGVKAGEYLTGFGMGDSILDNERFGMENFLIINNPNPSFSNEYYNLISGKHANGLRLTFGGIGIDSSAPPTKFMYPGISDPLGYGTRGAVSGGNWSEKNAQPGGFPNIPSDRKGVASMGPFKMK